MCESCGCETTDKPVMYKCNCSDECVCSVIGFDAEPDQTPYCCGKPMNRIK